MTSASQQLCSLMDTLDIKNIVFVDDNFQEDTEIASSIKGACDYLKDKGKISQINGLFDIDFSSTESIWKQKIETNWTSEYDDDKKNQILNALTNLCEDKSIIEPFYMKKITDLFTDKKFIGMTPEQWEDQKKGILKNCSKKSKLLLLFDKELGGNRDGSVIIKKIIKDHGKKESILFGLLTHTINTLNEEWDAWKSEFKNESKFIYPLAKTRLINDDSIIHGLKLIVLNYQCNKLKENLHKEVQNNNKEALEKLNELNIIHFDEIVFRSSNREGTLEIDTLLRLYYLLHASKTRASIKDNKDILNLASNIRQISSISSDEKKVNKDEIWNLQHMTMYESKKYLSNLPIPLELGDIFFYDKRFFILISQPCSLVIRNDGSRTAAKVILLELVKGHPAHNSLIQNLIENVESYKKDNISQQETRKNIIKAINNYETSTKYYPLNYFEKNQDFCVNFSKLHVVELDLLDLCVFDKKGEVKYSKSFKEPNGLTPGWKIRFEEINKKFSDILNKDKVNFESLSNGLIVDAKIEKKKSVNFNIKRIGRLKQPYSSDLLIKFSNYISRLGFEHEFTNAD